jgi:hypothetical protein
VDHRDLDAALFEWSPHHGLRVTTKDRGCEVRAIVIVDDAGTTYRLWLDLLSNGRLRVSASAPGHRRAVRACEPHELIDTLEQVYVEVISWIEAAGHARTTIL